MFSYVTSAKAGEEKRTMRRDRFVNGLLIALIAVVLVVAVIWVVNVMREGSDRIAQQTKLQHEQIDSLYMVVEVNRTTTIANGPVGLRICNTYLLEEAKTGRSRLVAVSDGYVWRVGDMLRLVKGQSGGSIMYVWTVAANGRMTDLPNYYVVPDAASSPSTSTTKPARP